MAGTARWRRAKKPAARSAMARTAQAARRRDAGTLGRRREPAGLASTSVHPAPPRPCASVRPCISASWSARANSAIVPNRPPADRDNARRIARSTSSGISGRAARALGTGSLSHFAITDIAVVPG